MEKPKARLLVVDDEESLCIGLKTYLELEGYSVDSALSAEQALKYDLRVYDLILLDIMMGGMSGTDFAVLLRSKKETAGIPVIFLTAKDSVEDMVDGLNIGADDYISKPYNIKNVIARIEAVLRRTGTGGNFPGIVCDRKAFTCTVDGSPVKLPRKEFELLDTLVSNPGRVFSRDELMARIWGGNVVVTDRVVDVHITRLRGKIAPYGKKIVTRSGYGYGWQD